MHKYVCIQSFSATFDKGLKNNIKGRRDEEI